MKKLSNVRRLNSPTDFIINPQDGTYIRWYNKFPKNLGGITALSVLRQDRQEFSERIEALLEIQEQLKSELLGAIQEVSEKDDDPYSQANQTILYVNMVLPFKLSLAHFTPDFKKMFRQLYVQSGRNIPIEIEKKISRALKLRKQLEHLIFHKEAINSLIGTIISKDYPIDIKSSFNNIRSSNQGKQNDPSAPQDRVNAFVADLVYKSRNREPGYDRFIHQSKKRFGELNVSKIVNEVMDQGLTGELKESAARERVNQALQLIE